MNARTSLFSLLFAGIGLTAILSGCGFKPLYGTAGGRDIPAELAKVEILPISDRSGQILRNGLIDKMNPGGRPTGAKYKLLVTFKIHKHNLGIRKD
jgi:LPS-assembly lipoprotein